LLRIYSATCIVINTISKDGASYSQRGDVEATYLALTSFEFVFILLLMKQIIGIIDVLCRALQQQDQDFVNVMSLVSTTKSLIQKLRDMDWNLYFRVSKNFVYRMILIFLI
jgi:hypothetical protein